MDSIKSLWSLAPEKQTVQVGGWVRTRRDSKAGISFLQISDGSCFNPIQIVIPNTIKNYHQDILHLTSGCSVKIKGLLVASPSAKQPVEILAEEVCVLGWVEDPDTYPISPKHHTMEYLRNVAHLRPRTNTFGAVTRLRHTTAKAIHDFFHQRDFFWVNTPIITSSDREGAGELFRVSTLDLMHLPHKNNGDVDFQKDFFGQETYLTVSGQLNVESHCLALSKVYTFGPTFRSENSNTSRHLAEFWMIEPEIAFANLQDDMALASALLKTVLARVLNDCEDDMSFFQERIDKDCIQRCENIVTTDFEYIEYRKAIELLQSSGKTFEYPVSFGLDLQSEHERYLVEVLLKKPVIVFNYPKAIKSFYMRVNDDNETVAAMDVLAPGIGEIIGGSQREERFDVLQDRMKETGLDTEKYAWYSDLRRYGTVPHAGFGLGFERLLCYITGLNNVRDVIPFPRIPGNADF